MSSEIKEDALGVQIYVTADKLEKMDAEVTARKKIDRTFSRSKLINEYINKGLGIEQNGK